MKTNYIFFLILLLALNSTLSFTQIPRTLSYQGVLTDSLGNPKPDGPYDIIFRLYNAPSDGNVLWSETKPLQVKRGLFTTILGDETPIPDSLKFNQPYWLCIQVASEPEMSPRLPLTAVGYSLYSVRSDTAQYAHTTLSQGYVDSARIAGTVPNNSIASQNILDGTIQRVDVVSTFTAPYADTAMYARGAPSQEFVDSARVAGNVPDNSITSAKILDGTIQRIDMQSTFKSPYSDTADYAKSAPPGGTAGGDLSGLYPNPTIASGAITSTMIIDGTIQRVDVTPTFTAPYSDTATYARYAPSISYVDSARIAGGVPQNSITSTHLVNDAVNSAKILDGSISSVDLANNTVTSAKIASGAVISDGLAASAVTTEKINNAAVTGAKIAQAGATDGQVMKWNGTTWLPGADLTGTATPGGATGQVQFNNAGAFGGDASFFWDNTNKRLGIGTASPSTPLHVSSTGTYSIYGLNSAIGGNGVYGYASAASGAGVGIRGLVASPDGYSGYFTGGRFYVSGNVGIGTTSPAALLHTQGTGTGQGNVVFVGEYKSSSPGNTPVSGAGTRMMWYPDQAAFRAGYVSGSQWDVGNIGIFSVAMGGSSTASGGHSTAFGSVNVASGSSSTAIGRENIASGSYSTAIGYQSIASAIGTTAMGWGSQASGHASMALGSGTTASGGWSTAVGNNCVASGRLSIAMGAGTIASGYLCTALGTNNVGGGDPITWVWSDPLFEIGNGFTAASRSNAMTVLKNGFVGIGTFNPTYPLDVAGPANFNKGIASGAALRCNGSEALWFDGTCFSWGYDGTYNYFADKVTIGNAANPAYMLYVQGNAYATGTWSSSDIRFKKNIIPIDDVLDRIMKIKGTSFEFRRDEFANYQFAEGKQFGFIAQELEEVFPELVHNENDGYKSLNYNGMIPVLLEAVKEQQKTIDDLQKRIEELETRAK